jgi:hypothetical protein
MAKIVKKQTEEVVATPKRRGRKPGSKNKKPTQRGVSAFQVAVQAVEKDMERMQKALNAAYGLAEKEFAKKLERSEKQFKKEMAKAEASVFLWKAKAMTFKTAAKEASKGRRGRPRKEAVEAAPRRRGRPAKSPLRPGAGRRKAGEPTRRDIIVEYVSGLSEPIKSGDLIQALFEKSGQNDKKRFSQGIYTTLTQIYKSGDLKNENGMISKK